MVLYGCLGFVLFVVVFIFRTVNVSHVIG